MNSSKFTVDGKTLIQMEAEMKARHLREDVEAKARSYRMAVRNLAAKGPDPARSPEDMADDRAYAARAAELIAIDERRRS
jgi:hypothetical protein